MFVVLSFLQYMPSLHGVLETRRFGFPKSCYSTFP
jgi:hypothetical protein